MSARKYHVYSIDITQCMQSSLVSEYSTQNSTGFGVEPNYLSSMPIIVKDTYFAIYNIVVINTVFYIINSLLCLFSSSAIDFSVDFSLS